MVKVTVHYSEGLIRRAIGHFWLRFIGLRGLFALVSIWAVFLFGLISGDRSWLVGVCGVLALLGAILAPAVYFVYLRRSLGALRRMNVPAATFTFTPAGFSLESDTVTSTLTWKSVLQVWRFPEAWLLFLGKNMFITLPTDGLSDEAMQLVVQGVQATGGKIV